MEILSFFGILIALAAFWFDYSDRKSERIARAWQLVTTKAPGQGGKGEALEYLVRNQQLLHRIDLSANTMGGRVVITNTDLSRADFSNADLSCVQFVGVNLTRSSFDDADLTGAFFIHSNISSASFSGADLTGARFSSTNFDSANFKSANVTSMKITKLFGIHHYFPFEQSDGKNRAFEKASWDGVQIRSGWLVDRFLLNRVSTEWCKEIKNIPENYFCERRPVSEQDVKAAVGLRIDKLGNRYPKDVWRAHKQPCD
jgi:hypothetical protein